MSNVTITTDALNLMVELNRITRDFVDAVHSLRSDMAVLKESLLQPILLTEEEAGKYIGMSASFLSKGRIDGVIGNRLPPPGSINMGDGDKPSVRYEVRELNRWVAEDLPRRNYPCQRSHLKKSA